ncbi:hypothetical protein F5Y00DRAFT_259567 [Daldinia vernicosa]|uniref:uncharacterized protein n=1 Tax=Daldinia vernicosa TaxID=114800 RepID=UPI0020076878|nr:uncharacterized protein F5Y00DRAFT_259567 [Daldinia vernicosa]KAI0851564.1 hypothetical protein F5Y00DRAFT_259567 [Daldinia vernicosa]
MAPKVSGTPAAPLRCLKCMATFATQRGLYLHQQKQGHLACGFCKLSFHDITALIQHRADDHKAEQDLPCPGCRTKFISAGEWIRHVERGECHAIFPSDISGNIVQAVESISKALAESKFEDVDYTVNSGKSYAEISDTWKNDETWNREQSLDARDNPERFPRTARQEFYQGGSKQTDLLTGDDGANVEQRPFNAWAQKKNLFPEKAASRAVPPPPSLLENMTRPSPSTQPTGQRIIDPDHPGFNAGLFWNPILEVFKCPHKDKFGKECGSKLKNSKGLIAHLRSPAHTSPRFQCPGCTNVFTSGGSWAQHAENVNESKCRIRNTPFYRQALNMITNGALDIDTLIKLANDMAKVKFDAAWAASKQRDESGPVPGSEAWVREKESEASKSQSDSEKAQPDWSKSESGTGKKITLEEYDWW